MRPVCRDIAPASVGPDAAAIRAGRFRENDAEGESGGKAERTSDPRVTIGRPEPGEMCGIDLPKISRA